MKQPRKSVALALIAVMALASSAGCLSVAIERVREPAAGAACGSLQVSVSQQRPRNGNGAPPEHLLVSELSRVDGTLRIVIRETSESRWSVGGLRPGKYRIRITSFIDEEGATRFLTSPIQKTFRIRAGDAVSAEIVVKRFPSGPVVAVGATVAGGILLAALISSLSGWGGGNGGAIHISGKGTKKLLPGRPLPAPPGASIPSAMRP